MPPDPVTCPCCGLPVHRPSADALALAFDLPAGQAVVLRALMSGRGAAVPASRVVQAMRDSDTRVDPRRAYRTALEAVSRLRPVVRRVGLEIASAGYGQGWAARWIG
jgi:hypothetical protein